MNEKKMTMAEALDILKSYRMELNTALDDVDGIPVILDALDVAIETMEDENEKIK